MSFKKQICQIQMLAHLNKTYMRASLRCMSIEMFGTYEYEEELSFSEVAALIEYMEMRAKTNICVLLANQDEASTEAHDL